VFSSVVELADSSMTSLFDSIGLDWDSFSSSISSTWSDFSDWSSTAWSRATTYASESWDDITEFSSSLWESATTFSSELWSSTKELASTSWGDITELSKSMWESTKEWSSGIWDDMKDEAKEMWDDFSEWGSSAWGKLKLTASSLWSDTKGWAEDFWSDIVGAYEGSWLESGVDGVVEGASNLWSSFLGLFSRSDAGVDGSHSGGLFNVPYDNYVANLHKGEMVLSAPEAQYYRSNDESALVALSSSSQSEEVSIYLDQDSVVDAIEALTEVVEDLYKLFDKSDTPPSTVRSRNSNLITSYL